MTAKEYLSQVYKLDHKIYLMQLEVEEYRRLASSIPGQDFTRERVDHTPSYEAPFVKWIMKAIDKEAEIKKKMEELQVLKAKVMGVIDEIEDDNLRMILKFRYINSMQFPDIADKMYASLATVYRWHREGLAQVKVPNA